MAAVSAVRVSCSQMERGPAGGGDLWRRTLVLWRVSAFGVSCCHTLRVHMQSQIKAQKDA